MDAKPGTREERAEGPRSQTAGERLGPIELRRMRKDDGRALLVYRHADEQR